MNRRRVFVIILVLSLFPLFVLSLYAEGSEVHGADSIFKHEGLTLVWATLKGQTEEETVVYLSITKTSPLSDKYSFYRVIAVDPFTGDTLEETGLEILKRENLVLRKRLSFYDYSGRRLHFYSTRDNFEQGKPDLIITYFGVPDTAPEITTREGVLEYLVQTTKRVSGE